jgi:pimeloyl-ACP methyl ester carboxylesterase
LQLCFASELTAAEFYCMLGYSASVPPFVRQALFSRVVDNDDLLPTIRRPVLITHGAFDAIVSKEAVEQHRTAISHAQVDIMPSVGHAAFWDDAPSFNARLGAFSNEVARPVAREAARIGGPPGAS